MAEDQTNSVAAADGAAQPASDGKIRLALSKPIRAFNEELSELMLRAPTGADIIHVGNPVEISFSENPSEMPRIRFDMMKVATMLSRLSGIPFASIERIEPGDLAAAALLISPFFMPSAPKT